MLSLHRFRPSYRFAVALAVLPLVVAGCSSSGGSSKPQSSGTTSGSATAGASSCAAAASAKLAKQEAPLNQAAPTTPIATANFKGKTAWFIQYLAAQPLNQQIAAGFQQAGAAIGVNTRVLDGKASPSVFNDAINQAVAANAAAIVIESLDPENVSGALENAASKHIPVVDLLGSSPTAPYPTGLVSHLTFDPAAMGAAQVDYALAKSACKTGLLYSAISGSTVVSNLVAGAKAEAAAMCPSCHFYVTNTAGADLATKLSGQVAAQLQQSPDIPYVMDGSDGISVYVEDGLKSIGKNNVGVIGCCGATLQPMQSGELPYQVADVVFMPTNTMGWYSMYEALQAASGGPKNQLVMATTTVDASNLHVPVEVPGYMDTFLKLFGVK